MICKHYPKLVGISGKMGCGKSVLTENIIDRHNFYKRHSIGDEVKKEVSERFGFPLEWCYDQATKKNRVPIPRQTIKIGEHKISVKAQELTVREIMQWWGTDVVRDTIDRDYWVKKLVASIGNDNVIIDDIRFPNEAELVKKAGGVLIRLEPYEGRGKIRGDGHESETALDGYQGFDLVVAPAFGTLPQLAQGVDLLLLKASKDSWQKVYVTNTFEQYIQCPHGCHPLKNVKACAGVCTRRCKVVRQWQKDCERVQRALVGVDNTAEARRRTFTAETANQLAKAC